MTITRDMEGQVTRSIFVSTRITAAGLKHLKGLNNLEELLFYDAKIDVTVPVHIKLAALECLLALGVIDWVCEQSL